LGLYRSEGMCHPRFVRRSPWITDPLRAFFPRCARSPDAPKGFVIPTQPGLGVICPKHRSTRSVGSVSLGGDVPSPICAPKPVDHRSTPSVFPALRSLFWRSEGICNPDSAGPRCHMSQTQIHSERWVCIGRRGYTIPGLDPPIVSSPSSALYR
jgi:hypothetical protein